VLAVGIEKLHIYLVSADLCVLVSAEVRMVIKSSDVKELWRVKTAALTRQSSPRTLKQKSSHASKKSSQATG
jgi:hypothetical protein